ncbi:MAG: tryptophan synthase subunit alpha [Alphaproteobacteria bacterium]|nr:tryptophan synthase subunit alpha [Alphaproteobacteria bacterium]
MEDKIVALRKQKPILLMTHLVLGYPSFEENRKVIREMVGAGAEIIEMQIPFSESWDGAVILKANDQALKNGANTTKCIEFADSIRKEFPDTIFVFMTYYNLLFAYGVEKFVQKVKSIGIEALIVPDIPPEEGAEYISACDRHNVASVFLFPPTSSPERLKEVGRSCRGMVYCVGRKGVTGSKTTMDNELKATIQRYREATSLPLALGFGVQEKEDVEAITGLVDIAVIGTKLIVLHQEQGAAAVGHFLKSVRS